MVGELVGARVQLAIGQLLLLEDHGDRRRGCARPGPRTAGGCTGRAGCRPAVAFHSHQQLLPLGCGQQRQVATAARPGRAISRAAAREVAHQARDAWRRRTGRWCTRDSPSEPSSASLQRQRQVELGACVLGTPAPASVHAGQLQRAPAGRSAARTSPGTAACGSGRAAAAAPRPAARRAGPGARRRPGSSRTRASSSRKRGSPARSVRSTRVLTKKPISPSVSARLRLATGVPTTMSLWPL